MERINFKNLLIYLLIGVVLSYLVTFAVNLAKLPSCLGFIVILLLAYIVVGWVPILKPKPPV